MQEPVKPENTAVATLPERSEKQTDVAAEETVAPELRRADEGEFMHLKATGATGLELFGKVVRYLRKKGTANAARARELLSRDVVVRERPDAIAFVAPDDVFLMMTDERVVTELDEALSSFGANKKARVQRTAEDLFYDDVNKAVEYFSRDCTHVAQ